MDLADFNDWIQTQLGADYYEAVQDIGFMGDSNTTFNAPSGGYDAADLGGDMSGAVTNDSTWDADSSDYGYSPNSDMPESEQYAQYGKGRAAQTQEELGTKDGLLKQIEDWTNKHKELTKILAGVAGGAAKAHAAKELEKLKMQMAVDLKAAHRKANSASVVGLKPIKSPGLIGGLKRADGSNVFQGNGQLLGA